MKSADDLARALEPLIEEVSDGTLSRETGLGDGRWRCTECGRAERHDS